MASKEQKTVEAETGKKYYRVRFHEKTDENAPDHVTLGVNGNLLVIKRGEEVILPEEYRKCAEQAVIRYNCPYTKDNKNYVKRVCLARFPFDVLGEATEEEFLRMKTEGTKKTVETLQAEQEESNKE